MLERWNWLQRALLSSLTVPTSWAVAALAGLLVLLLSLIVYRAVFGALARLAAKTTTDLDDQLVRRMRPPAQVLAYLLSIHTVLTLHDVHNSVLRTSVLLLELLLTAYLVIEATETIVIFYWLGERQQIRVPPVFRHLLQLLAYVVGVLSIVGSVTGINLAPLLATSTVITVVFGLALQDTIGNLFSGIALQVEKPFDVGDWIMTDGLEGRVVYTGWRSTHLRTFTGDLVAIPNSTIAKARIQNFYRPTKLCARNIEMLVSLSASPETVERAFRAACAAVSEICADPAPKFWLVAITPLAQRYIIKFWIRDFDAHDDLESDVLKAAWHTCVAENIQLPAATAIAAMDPSQPGGAVVAAARSSGVTAAGQQQ